MGAKLTRLRRRRGPHDCPAVQRSAALAAELRGMDNDGRVYVRIAHVLEAIDPGGLRLPPDPRADPLTGCLPVTAEAHGDQPG